MTHLEDETLQLSGFSSDRSVERDNVAAIDDSIQGDNDDFGAEVEIADISSNQRVPVVLVLDTSGSMSGKPIKQLNDALKSFEDSFDISKGGDPEVARSGEVALISFGYNGVQIHDLATGSGTVSDASQAFVEGLQFRAPTLQAGGGTPMGQAMTLALHILEQRKKHYRSNQIPYYRPMLFLISDGAPDPGWEPSAAEAKRQMTDKHVLIYPIGVANAKLETLSNFSTISALPLAGLKFAELFQFISNSMGQVARLEPGAQAAVFDTDLLNQWVQAPVTHD